MERSLSTPTDLALRLAEQEAFWLKTLYGDIPVIDAMLDYPRPHLPLFQHDSLMLTLDSALSEKIQILCRREGVDLLTVVLTALSVVFARHTAQERVLFGTVSADSTRHLKKRSASLDLLSRPDSADHGFQERFTNPIALLIDVADDPCYQQLLKRVAALTIQASQQRDYPFEQLQSHLGGRDPLFQVFVAVLHTVWAEMNLPLTEQHLEEIGEYLAPCDLVLRVFEQEQGISIRCDYAVDLFLPATVRLLLDHVLMALSQITHEEDQPISHISLIGSAEQEQIRAWNQTTVPGAYDGGLHTIFERQAVCTPDAQAVVFGESSLSYQQLDQQAQQLAFQLRQANVGPGVRVGLYIERSLEMVVALLAVLKGGGAYIPLDVSDPPQRTQLQLQTIQAHILLTQPHLLSRLPEHKTPLLLVGQGPVPQSSDTSHELVSSSAKDLACILFTSGSTGVPKGVLLSHKMLLNLIEWHLSSHLPATRTLQFATFSFDQSIHEMFSTWSSGGTLFLLQEDGRSDMHLLANTIHEQKLEKLFLPVIVAQKLCEVWLSNAQLPGSLREMIVTGEQLRITQPMRELFTQLEDARLYNHYGPTETHVVTEYELPHGQSGSWPILPPIGKPIANTKTWILDDHLQQVAIGIWGELYISGDCLAQGYWQQPDSGVFLTREDGTRMYKTGDIVRYRPDGHIEFQGRRDDQIKIRGLRIEPGEIEATLMKHTSVQTAVVLAHRDALDEVHLVAYIVPVPNVVPDVAEIRSFLASLLPPAMVPTSFAFLQALPLTSNGKVDRRALPVPEKTGEAPFAVPRTSTEIKLVAIWSDILHIDTIGIYDNFFALGGHSLLGAQMIAQIRETFQVEMTHLEIFDTPTIAAQAEEIEDLLALRGHTIPDARQSDKEVLDL